VGATFRIEICFFGCVDIDITVSLGADLHVLGPPFHGEVTVDLEVASVTVPFGPTPNQNKLPIPWGDFVTKYLHSGTSGNEPVIPHVITGLQPPEPAGGQPSPGSEDQPWKMTSEFSFRSETRMPAMEFSFLTSALRRNENEISTKVFGHYGPLSSVFDFDVAPVAIANANLATEHIFLIDGWNEATRTWSPILPADNVPAPAGQEFTVNAIHFQVEPIIGQISEAPYHIFAHDNVPAAANTLPALVGLKVTGIAVLRNPSQPIPITSLYDYGLSRPLPFATWSPSKLGVLQALGAAADALIPIAAKADTETLLTAAHSMLIGGGFFAEARSSAGLPLAGLPALSGRSLLHFRSSPPAILPITTGLTMRPVGLDPPPAFKRVGTVLPVLLESPRLRAVLQGRPVPTQDAPPLVRTTVSTLQAAKGAPRMTPPKLDTIPGARLHTVRAAHASRPTALARSSRTLRHVETGWALGKAHRAQFEKAEKLIRGDGITLPAGTTHIWDLPATAGQVIRVAGSAAARITFLSRAGYVVSDLEVQAKEFSIPVPEAAAMVAVTCLGNPPASPSAVATQGKPGLGAVTFAAGNRNAVVGWQTGNLVPQASSTTLLGRGCVITLRQAALTNKRQLAAAQATVRLSEALVDQPGVETWLPVGIGVVALILDIVDPSATQEGDLAIAVKGATLSTQPVRVAGGNRKMLFYDVLSRKPDAQYISVSAASRDGLRVAGVLGLSGHAQEWGIRLNGRVPEHLVAEGPLTPHGQIVVRISGGSR
jgi:hypothetical protein